MFVHWIEFEIAPGKVEAWETYVPPYLQVQAIQPGGVCFRVMRAVDGSRRGVAWRVWLTDADGERAKASPEIIAAGAPARDQKLYSGPGAAWRPRELYRFEAGDSWPGSFLQPGLVVIERSPKEAAAPLSSGVARERMRPLSNSGPDLIIETVVGSDVETTSVGLDKVFLLQFGAWGPEGHSAYDRLAGS